MPKSALPYKEINRGSILENEHPHPLEAVILSERGPRRFLQPGGGESKDLRLFLFTFEEKTILSGPKYFPKYAESYLANLQPVLSYI
jgi:hypothetical protein